MRKIFEKGFRMSLGGGEEGGMGGGGREIEINPNIF